jgi:hypothetical protein
MLSACIFVIALALSPIAIRQQGSGAPLGLIVAAMICLISGLAADWLSCFLTRNGSPLAGQLSGMMVRMFLPLVVCLVLVAKGYSGRENLAFVCYLLIFYVATLALETWLAVKRAAASGSAFDKSAR